MDQKKPDSAGHGNRVMDLGVDAVGTHQCQNGCSCEHKVSEKTNAAAVAIAGGAASRWWRSSCSCCGGHFGGSASGMYDGTASAVGIAGERGATDAVIAVGDAITIGDHQRAGFHGVACATDVMNFVCNKPSSSLFPPVLQAQLLLVDL